MNTQIVVALITVTGLIITALISARGTRRVVRAESRTQSEEHANTFAKLQQIGDEVTDMRHLLVDHVTDHFVHTNGGEGYEDLSSKVAANGRQGKPEAGTKQVGIRKAVGGKGPRQQAS